MQRQIETSLTQKALLATKIIFFSCGISFGSWAVMVPYVKERLHYDEAQLGILLLALGIGAILMMPVGGQLSRTIGNQKAVFLSSILGVIILPTLLIWETPIIMGIALFAFGAALGSMDITMNAHGILVQKEHQKSVMSTLHGMFSVGGLVGPVVFSGLIKLGATPLLACILVAFSSGALLLWSIPQMYSFETEKKVSQTFNESSPTESNSVSAWTSLEVWLLGFMCFAVFLSEGSMLDWSAVYLTQERNIDPSFAGMGFAVFSIAMATMRLSGDYLIAKLNEQVVVLGGAIIGGIGVFMMVFAPWIVLSLVGFLLLGIGAANIVPVLFSSAGRIKGIPVGVALPAISMLGYTGQLTGPALIGFIAHQFSLTIALSVCGVLMLLIAVAYFIKPRN